MHYGLTLVTAASTDSVTATEAKSHARIDISDDDTLIANYITAATQWAQSYTRRQFVTATYDLTLDKFPWDEIRVPLPPLSSVTSISYLDEDQVSQTLATTFYTVDAKSEPGRITRAYQTTLPSILAHINAVTVRFVCGYGAASTVPEAIKTAIRQLVAHWYENRETVVVGQPVAQVPQTCEYLLDPYRVVDYVLGG